MGTNRYQGQIRLLDYEDNKRKDIFKLIKENQTDSSIDLSYIKRIGICAEPGTVFSIMQNIDSNEIQIVIGSTGIYECNNVLIKSLKLLTSSNDMINKNIIIDYII